MSNSSKEDLIKGFYSLFNSDYNSKPNNTITSYEKKGSEIKEGLSNILNQINKQKANNLDTMNSFLGKISFAPDSTCPEFDEYAHLLDFIPKKFSYSLLYKGENYVKTDNGIEQTAVKLPSDEEKNDMREYNESVYKYINLCINKLKIESLKRNIEDKKNYQLSIDQLAILGL